MLKQSILKQLHQFISMKNTYKMRYKNLLGETIATELSDLKWGEFRCTNCNKVITEKDVIPNDKNQRITTNSINFCSSKCRSENRLTYDRNVRRIG